MAIQYFAGRVTAPEKSNTFYYDVANPYVKKGYGLPNCTCYACGRLAEAEGDFVKELAYGNAEDWYDASSLQKGQEPRLGAVMCWRKGQTHRTSDGAGHVAVVEQIDADGKVTVSESHYSGTLFDRRTFTKGNYTLGKDYTFQGFLYPKSNFVKLTVIPEERDTTKTQVELTASGVRYRPEPSVKALSYGTLDVGFYNVKDTCEADGYTWVKIEDNPTVWVAVDDAWAKILPAEEDEKDKRIAYLTARVQRLENALNNVKATCIAAAKEQPIKRYGTDENRLSFFYKRRQRGLIFYPIYGKITKEDYFICKRRNHYEFTHCIAVVLGQRQHGKRL